MSLSAALALPASADAANRIERLSIAVPADGRAVLAWYDPDAGTVNLGKCRDLRCMAPPQRRVIDTGGRAGAGLSLTIGANGHPLLAYQDAAATALVVSACTTADCSASTRSVIDEAGLVGAFTSIAVGADGRPLVSYYDASAARVKIARCSDATCRSASTQAIDWYLAGPHSAAGVAADGRPVVAFQDEHGALLYARCSDADCSGIASIEMIDGSASGAGFAPTLRFGGDGRAVISYIGSRRITLAHCNDASCSAATVTDIDEMGPDGVGVDSPSLAIDRGLPLVGYRRDDGRLRVAQCADAACSSDTRRIVNGRADAPGTALAVSNGVGLLAYVEQRNGRAEVKVTTVPRR